MTKALEIEPEACLQYLSVGKQINIENEKCNKQVVPSLPTTVGLFHCVPTFHE